ncbi:hypothetical protein D3C81_2288410 [compost metagenome]
MDDDHATPVVVPSWQPDTQSDQRLAEYALKVMELSKGIEETVAQYQVGAER